MNSRQFEIPFNPLQAGMLRGSMAEPGSHVEQVEIEFSTDLTYAEVEAAWDATVHHTEALRLSLAMEGSMPRAWQPAANLPALQRASGSSGSFKDWREIDLATPLLISDHVPWRITFWPEAKRCVWTVHHALLDGRSMTRVVQTFLECLLLGNVPQPTCYPRWSSPTELQISQAEQFHRHEFSKVENTTFPGGHTIRSRRTLGNALAASLQSLALERDITVPTVLTWAWGRALMLVTGQESVALGQVRAGVPCSTQLGFSMNTAPLVVRRESDSPHALRTRMKAMRAFEQVALEHLDPQIFSSAGGPWSSVIMTEHGTLAHLCGKVAQDPRVKQIHLHESGSNQSRLAAAWILPNLELEVTAPMSETLIELWEHQILQWIEAPENSPEIPTAIQNQLLAWGDGGPPIPGPEHLAQMWAETSIKHSTQIAIQTRQTQITYQKLAKRVSAQCHHLARAGAKPGSVVAVYIHDRQYLAIAMLAIAELGAIYLPLDPLLPEAGFFDILNQVDASLIITDQPEKAARFKVDILDITDESPGVGEKLQPNNPADTLALIFTSGSTGRPKGVMLNHQGIMLETRAIADTLALCPGDKVLQFASPGFDASLEEIIATLLSGATLVPRPNSITEQFSQFHEFIQHQEITVLDLSTAYWAAWCAWMASENRSVPHTIRATIIGGERCSATSLSDWNQCGGSKRVLLNTYGPTETSIVATAHQIHDDWHETCDPPIGRPLAGFSVRVVDSKGRLLPPGIPGELWIGGPGVGPGYWRLADKTARAFVHTGDQRFYRTGDHVRWDDSGRLHFLGRLDDQLKIRGQRIEPDSVIRLLELHPSVAKAHVGQVLCGNHNHLAAWLQLKDSPQGDWIEPLTVHLKNYLPAASIPTRWATVESFKLTLRGKTDRKLLPEPLPHFTGGTHREAPDTNAEKRLATLWEELLEIESISRDDNFFDLGGDSLSALALFAKVSKAWQIELPMASLLEAPTIRLLAAMLEAPKSHPTGKVKITPVKATGNLAPFFCIHGGDGGIIFYRNLAKHLHKSRPLLAIESPDLGTMGEPKPTPIEQVAEQYIEAIQSHQPSGPYYLGGYSYGGVVVYEIARTLISNGETVHFLALFDTVNPAIPLREYTLMERAEVYWEDQKEHPWFCRVQRLLQRISDGVATHLRVRRERSTAIAAKSTDPHTELRALQVREANWQAMEAFRPQPLPGKLHLFKTDNVDDKYEVPYDYGWSHLVQEIEILKVPGKHLEMFATQNVASLAKSLNNCI